MGNVTIIGLHGYPGVGKDAIAAELAKSGWIRVAFADPVRQAVLALNPLLPLADGFGGHIRFRDAVERMGWDALKRQCPEVRELLQRMGTEAGREIHGDDCWINAWKRTVSALTSPPAVGSKIVVTDVRFENEIDAIVELGGVVVEITREGYGPVNDHCSERRLTCDLTIANDADIATVAERVRAEAVEYMTEIAT